MRKNMVSDNLRQNMSYICETSLEKYLVIENDSLRKELSLNELHIEDLARDRDVAEEKYERLNAEYTKLKKDYGVIFKELTLVSNLINKISNNALVCDDFLAFNTLEFKDKESLEFVKVIDKISGTNYLDKALEVVACNVIKNCEEKDNG